MAFRVLNVASIGSSFPGLLGKQYLTFKKKEYEFHFVASPSDILYEYSKSVNGKAKGIEITRSINPFKDLLAIFKLSFYIFKNRFQVVVGHTPKGALLSMLSSWLMRVPKRVYFRHGLVYETMTGFSRKIMILVEKLTAFCATDIICVSSSLCEKSLKDKLNKSNKQYLLGKGTCGGIDAKTKFNPKNLKLEIRNQIKEQIGISDQTFVVGFCGRLVRDKGVIELIDGFQKFVEQYTQNKFVLLIMGPIEERDSLPKATVESIHNNKNIHYAGSILENIEYYYSLMDVFVLPSYREGFGLVNIEAAAMEIPVLTTKNTGCIDSIVEGVTGAYIDLSRNGIFEGIETVFLNGQRKQLGLNGRQMVLENFDNSTLWPIIENVLYS